MSKTVKGIPRLLFPDFNREKARVFSREFKCPSYPRYFAKDGPKKDAYDIEEGNYAVKRMFVRPSFYAWGGRAAVLPKDQYMVQLVHITSGVEYTVYLYDLIFWMDCVQFVRLDPIEVLALGEVA